MIRKRNPEILQKYPVDIPTRFSADRKWDAYDYVKGQFYRKYGWVDPRDYDDFIGAVVEIMGL